jgi:hypothetical protein
MAATKSTRSRKRRTRQFPQVAGKIVDDVELSLSTDYRAVHIRFQDKTALTLDLQPCFWVTPTLADWKTGDCRLLKQWRPVHS